MSADGRIVAFSSSATNLVDGPDMNGPAGDVYTFDTAAGTIRRVSAIRADVNRRVARVTRRP